MIKDTNKQICVVISKEINEKLKEEAKKNNDASRNWIARKILTDYFKDKQ